jgi:hypothetical protein
VQGRPAAPSRRETLREQIMTKRTIIATAASIFAAGGLITAAHAEGVKCSGTNACKGQSACKGATNSCKGQNACKGQGFTETSTSLECTAKGGKVL